MRILHLMKTKNLKILLYLFSFSTPRSAVIAFNLSDISLMVLIDSFSLLFIFSFSSTSLNQVKKIPKTKILFYDILFKYKKTIIKYLKKRNLASKLSLCFSTLETRSSLFFIVFCISFNLASIAISFCFI